MHYVYFLKTNKSNLYIGRTNNLSRRIREHNGGNVSSTKAFRPLILLGYKIYASKDESIKMEKEWKKSHKRRELKKTFKI